MSFNVIDPSQAHDLLSGEGGHVYVDVRTEEEFAQGHPEGSVNVPVFERDAAGRMAPNPEFMAVMQALYAHDAPLLLGCAMGGRSAQACSALSAAGWTDVSNVHGGFSGHPGGPGAPPDAGWARRGLPVSTDLAGCSYADVKASKDA